MALTELEETGRKSQVLILVKNIERYWWRWCVVSLNCIAIVRNQPLLGSVDSIEKSAVSHRRSDTLTLRPSAVVSCNASSSLGAADAFGNALHLPMSVGG